MVAPTTPRGELPRPVGQQANNKADLLPPRSERPIREASLPRRADVPSLRSQLESPRTVVPKPPLPAAKPPTPPASLSAERQLVLLGGGFTSSLLCAAGRRLGIRSIVLDPDSTCPAAAVCAGFVQGELQHAERLHPYVNAGTSSAVVTVEDDRVPGHALEAASLTGRLLPPPHQYRLLQDRLLQKQHLRALGLPTVEFHQVESATDCVGAIEQLGGSVICRARLPGGQASTQPVGSVAELQNHLLGSASAPFFVERHLAVTARLLCVVVVGSEGSLVTYPLCELVNNSRDAGSTVIAPARCAASQAHSATEMAIVAARSFGSPGAFSVVLLCVGSEGSAQISSVRFGLHKAAGFTLKGCVTDAYENQLRALTGLPLGSTELVPQHCAAVMIPAGDKAFETASACLAVPRSSLFWCPGLWRAWLSRSDRLGGRKDVAAMVVVTAQSPAALAGHIDQLNGQTSQLAGPEPASSASTESGAVIAVVLEHDGQLALAQQVAMQLEQFDVQFAVFQVIYSNLARARWPADSWTHGGRPAPWSSSPRGPE